MTALPQMTFEGAAGGMNAAVAPHEIGDNQGAYIQDVLLHKPGLLVRRGPMAAPAALTAGVNDTGVDEPVGIVQVVDPAGNTHIGVLAGNNTHGILYTYKPDFTAGANLFLASPTFPLPGTSGKVIVDSKPMLNGGTLIGLSESYELGGRQHLYIWRGGVNVDYTTGTVTTTAGSKTVTGSGTSWTTSNVSPGMHLILSGIVYGVVKSIDSGTQITLENGAPYSTGTAAYTLTSLRGFRAKVMTGTISTSTGSKTVSGSGTKFKSQGWSSNYDIFRASDMALVGRVSTVSNDSGLTLAANASVSMANEPYVAWDITANTSPDLRSRPSNQTPGFLNCIWDRKQWYANLNLASEGRGDYTTRVWASSEADPEAVDFSPIDGDFLNIPSTKQSNSAVRALVPAFDSLVVLKSDEGHAIVGTSGNYSTRKISDDGALCGMSAVPWGAGAVWAGRNGVWLYDGMQAANITENTLGDFWKTSIANFNPGSDRMWGFVYRDHYVLNIENVTPPRGPVKGAVETIPTRLIVVIHLPTQAVSTFTNVHHRGAINISSSFGSAVWYVYHKAGGSSSWKIADAANLFETSGLDSNGKSESNAVSGPDFYFESKRYSLGDGMMKKAWRQLAMTYNSLGTEIVLDTILGLNQASTTAHSTFLPTSISWHRLGQTVSSWTELGNTAQTWTAIASQVYQTHRIKFMKRSQHLGFRLYQPVGSSPSQEIVIGPWALAYKLLPGKY